MINRWVSSVRRWLGRNGLTIYTSIFAVVMYIFKYRKFKAIPAVKRGFEDHRQKRITNNAEYMAIFKRLSDAYNKAKSGQKSVAQPYKVGYMWQQNLDNHFADLIVALQNKDSMKLQTLLENFDREWFTYGMGGETDYYAMKRNPLYKYQFVNTWYKCFNLYKELANGDHKLAYPMVGNPAGLYYDKQIIPLDAIRFHYYAAQILSLLRDVENPVVCEIGSGLGGQAYKVLSTSGRPITYILLDIPEMLAVSSYFLMAALPEKRFLLYGESANLGNGKLNDYDVILMPNFMLPQLEDEKVDLFFNSASFSEMDSMTVAEYIRQIERICRRYLLHVNHNQKFIWHYKGQESANMLSTQVQLDPNRFKQVYKFKDSFLLAREEEKIYYRNAAFYEFLYERIKAQG